MTPIQYLQTQDYRRRLVGMIESAKSYLLPSDFAAFSASIQGELTRVDLQLRTYVETIHFSRWVGIETVSVCNEVFPAEPNIFWNTPVPTFPGFISYTERQMKLDFDDEPFYPNQPCLA